MKTQQKKRILSILPLAVFFMVGAVSGGIMAPFWQKDSTTTVIKDDWRTYSDEKGMYTLEYPSFLTPGTTDTGVEFSDGSGFGEFSLTQEASLIKAENTKAWIALQSQYTSPLFSVQNSIGQSFVVVGQQVQRDSVNGVPAYATVLSAVEVINGTVYKLSWKNETLSENGDLPIIGESLVKILESFTVTIPPLSAEDQAWHDANAALAQFLGLLHEKTYAAAAQNFRGDMNQLQDWNPDLGSTDDARLWERGCEQNGLQCLAVKSITPIEVLASGTYTFSVMYETDSGEIYSQKGKDTFLFEVKRGVNGLYFVQTLPPYQE